ncbi:hypothetical protein CBS101457_003827 [Exobasidium rhododendri]|nr:hypothetical protein CBS101457_003827 [Exobasidium rhododendri]
MSTTYLSRVLPVPLGDEVVELSLDDLPTDMEDYIQVLREERCPPQFWLKLASECGARKRSQDCEAVILSALQTLSSVPPPDQPYRSQHAIAEEVAPFHAMLSTLHLGKARQHPKVILPDAKYQNLLANSPGLENKDRIYQTAKEHAKGIVFPPPSKAPNSQQQPTSLRTNLLLGRGIFLTATAETEEALKAFKAVLVRQSRNPIALLGSACCLLRKKEYSSALTQYQEVLRISIAQSNRAAKESATVGPDGELVENQASKWLGPDPRIGIGLCLQGLGRSSEARRAWNRSIAIDPSNAAAHLLLGLSKLNAAKQLSNLSSDLAGLAATESEARALIYKDGLSHIEISWKLDNKNSMTAIVLAEHFQVRALATSVTDAAQAQKEYERALKLGEHAIQYADNRAAVNHAWLVFARTAHLYSFLDETSTSTVELRSIAQRHYTRVIEDLGRVVTTSSSESSPLPSGYATAILGLAQLQVSRGENLGAINTMEAILSRSISTSSSCLEISLLAASLRAHSHIGASSAELANDRKRARILLDRTLRSIEACNPSKKHDDDMQDIDALFQEVSSSQDADQEATLALARTALANEDLSESSLEEISKLGMDELAYVQLADLYQNSKDGHGSGDLSRAIQCFTQALRVVNRKRTESGTGGVGEEELESLGIRLQGNLGALLGTKGIESTGELSAQALGLAVRQLQAGLEAAGKAVSNSSLDAEKTTTLYNLGRVLEASGHVEDAQKAYDAVLATHPEYVDAKVRQALLIVCKPTARGSKEATQLGSTLFKEALSSDPVNLDTRSTFVCFLSGELPGSPNPPQWEGIKESIAQLFMGGSSTQAIQLFGSAGAAKSVSDEARHDAYTLSSLAWAYYNIGHSVKPGSNAKAEKLRALLRCCDLLDKALAEDSRCAFALQGLAILLAEGSMVDLLTSGGASSTLGDVEMRKRKAAEEALNIFTKLREVDEGASVHICMGHAYMARDDYNRALKSYELAAKKEQAKPSLLQYLSKATFHLGMETKSYQQLQMSIDYLQEAIEQLKKRESASASIEVNFLRYNIGVTRQKMIQLLFDQKMEDRKLETLERAMEGVKESQVEFKDLTQDAIEGKLSNITGEMIEQRQMYGENTLLRQAVKHMEEQRQYEEESREKREAAASRKREREEALEQERLELEEQRRQRAEQLAEERRKAIEEARTWEYYQNEMEEKPKKSRKSGGGGGGSKKNKKKKKRKGDEGGSEIESSDDDAGASLDESEDDNMIVSDEEELEQGDLSDNELERKRESKSERKEARQAEKAAKKREKRARKERKVVEKESDDEGSESDEPRPTKKPKKSKMRKAVEEDLIESEEEM